MKENFLKRRCATIDLDCCILAPYSHNFKDTTKTHLIIMFNDCNSPMSYHDGTVKIPAEKIRLLLFKSPCLDHLLRFQQGCNQGGLRGLKPPLARSNLRKKIKSFNF